jgi:hypothetical protein
VHLLQPSGQATSVEIAADLAGASVAVPELGWTEPALSHGSARLTLAIEGDRLARIDPIKLRAGAIEADGRLALGAGGAIERVDIDRLLRGETDVKVSVSRQPEREFAIRVEGPSLDLAPLFEGESKSKSDSAGPGMRIHFKTDRLRLSPKIALADATADLAYDGKVWRSITAAAAAGSTGGGLKLALSADDPGHRFTLSSPDAGAALAGLGVLDNFSGGTLLAEGKVDIDAPGMPLDGHFDIRDATLIHAPVLARVASLASLTGIDEALSGRGVGFSRIGGKVKTDAEKIGVDNFGAYGPPLGLTCKGDIARATDAAHFDCTLVPANGLSQMIGVIPLIGHIITGFKTEGVLAVDFVVDGTLDQPQVKVNPLTVIAPGFLRDLVRLFGPAEGMAHDIERSAGRD